MRFELMIFSVFAFIFCITFLIEKMFESFGNRLIFPAPDGTAASDYQAHFSQSAPEHAKVANNTHRKYVHWMLDNHERLIGFIKAMIVPQLQSMGREKMKTLRSLEEMTGCEFCADDGDATAQNVDLDNETKVEAESKSVKADFSWQRQMHADTCKLRDLPLSNRVSTLAPDPARAPLYLFHAFEDKGRKNDWNSRHENNTTEQTTTKKQ